MNLPSCSSGGIYTENSTCGAGYKMTFCYNNQSGILFNCDPISCTDEYKDTCPEGSIKDESDSCLSGGSVLYKCKENTCLGYETTQPTCNGDNLLTCKVGTTTKYKCGSCGNAVFYTGESNIYNGCVKISGSNLKQCVITTTYDATSKKCICPSSYSFSVGMSGSDTVYVRTEYSENGDPVCYSYR